MVRYQFIHHLKKLLIVKINLDLDTNYFFNL